MTPSHPQTGLDATLSKINVLIVSPKLNTLGRRGRLSIEGHKIFKCNTAETPCMLRPSFDARSALRVAAYCKPAARILLREYLCRDVPTNPQLACLHEGPSGNHALPHCAHT